MSDTPKADWHHVAYPWPDPDREAANQARQAVRDEVSCSDEMSAAHLEVYGETVEAWNEHELANAPTNPEARP